MVLTQSGLSTFLGMTRSPAPSKPGAFLFRMALVMRRNRQNLKIGPPVVQPIPVAMMNRLPGHYVQDNAMDKAIMTAPALSSTREHRVAVAIKHDPASREALSVFVIQQQGRHRTGPPW